MIHLGNCLDVLRSTPTRLQEIRQRAERATPGPWTAQSYGPYPVGTRVYGPCEPRTVAQLWRADCSADAPHRDTVTRADTDAEFIAHAREDIPALLTLWDTHQTALRALVEQWKDAADMAARTHPNVERAFELCARDLERLLTPEQS